MAYKVLRTTEIITQNKELPSRCYDIAFFNQGSNNVYINGIKIVPSASLSFSQNIVLANDVTKYSARFDSNVGSNLLVIRTFIEPIQS